MPVKSCEYCGTELRLRNSRDITRKRFCSRSCLGHWVGERHTPERIAKFVVVVNTLESNKKKGRPGATNHKWLSDRSLVKYRPRYEGRIWKDAVFTRDNYTCQLCGIHGGKLQADHIKPYCKFPELRWEVSNGRTLCINCHRKTPTYGTGALYACA